MSKSTGHNIGAVVEWSPNGANSYEPLSKRRSAGATLNDLGLTPNGHTTVLAVSRRTAFVKPTHVPNAGEAEIRQILQLQLAQLFPVAPGELAYDLWLTGNVSAEGRLAVVCGVQSDTLKNLNSQATQAGIKSSTVVPAGLGSALLARSLGLKDCTVVERTTEGLAIDIVVGGELRWSRVVPASESNASIEAEIERTHVMAAIPRAKVVAAGGLDYSEADFRSQASTLEFLASPQAQNLGVHLELPEAVAQRTAKAHTSKLRRAVALVVIAALAWGKVGYDASVASSARNLQDSQWQKKVSSARSAFQAAETSRKAASTVNDVLTRALRPAQSFADVLTVIGNDASPSMWLGGATLERGKPIIVRGTAMNSEAVAAYLQKLTSEQRFKNAKLIFANNGLIDTTPVVQFSIELHAIGNLPVSETNKDKRKR